MNWDEFRNWLIQTLGFKKKSAIDVVSRVKRISKFIDIDSKIDQEDLRNQLNDNIEYSALSKFVRPQLRRAALLYWQFQSKN